MKRYASLDIGSQTIRLLIADIEGSILYPILRKRSIVRLGAGMQPTGMLLPDAIVRATDCIAEFTDLARRRGALEIAAAATACVRCAHNARAFLGRIENTCGILPVVLTGPAEAVTSLAGVRAVISQFPPRAIVIDIGGGSTELNYLENGNLHGCSSIPLGVITLAENHLHSDPPSTADITAMRSSIHSVLTAQRELLPGCFQAGTAQLIATAGTATTLAAMDLCMTDYAAARINGHILDLSVIKALFQKMLTVSLAERIQIAGLEPGRAQVIIPGALIMIALLERYNCRNCTVCDAGLLEGILAQRHNIQKVIEKS